MAKKIRKCFFCKKDIDTSIASNDYFFFERAKTRVCAHKDCYIGYYTSNERRSPMTIEQCQKFISEEEKKPEPVVKPRKKTATSELYDFISDMYGLTYFPKYFFSFMASIYKGTYKNLNRPVPPEDLLDMWKQKKKYLLRQAENNRKKGKDINGISLVYYDLAILLGKYDAYLKWKEQQKLAQADAEEQRVKNIEFVRYRDVLPQRQKKENNTIDISSMLDEI